MLSNEDSHRALLVDASLVYRISGHLGQGNVLSRCIFTSAVFKCERMFEHIYVNLLWESLANGVCIIDNKNDKIYKIQIRITLLNIV